MGPPTIYLAVHAKKTEPLDLKHPLLDYVAATYGQKAAQDAADDLEEVNALRAQVAAATGSLHEQRATLAKYFRVLSLMETRFPISRAPDHAALAFDWGDAFRPRTRAEQASVHFEKAAVAFNIGAVQSQAGLGADRRTEEGLVQSAKLFQEAAGTFAYLRDVACLKVEAPRPTDLTPEAASMLEKLMLAQAQECVLEKASNDKKSPAVIARRVPIQQTKLISLSAVLSKAAVRLLGWGWVECWLSWLAKQASLFYTECSRLLSSPPLNQHFDRSWLAHATVKSQLYDVESIVQNSAALRDADPIAGVAKEIARLRASQGILAAAKKEAKNASKELQDNVAAKEAAVATRLVKAERENATVYLQRVPDEADLPPIAPHSVVRPVPPPDLRPTEEQQHGLFTTVVPDTSAKALSRYTDMVDGLIRRQLDALAGASDEARLRLREWELPEALNALEAGTTAALPDGVRAELEAIQEAGGVRHLQEVQQQIRELRAVACEELEQCEADLAAEAAEDEELRGHYGARWRRAPSAQLTKVMRDKVAGYRSNLDVAGESDKRLDAKLASEAAAFAALDPEAAATQMPRLQSPMLSVDNMEPATAVSTLRGALEGLATLSGQRAALEEALKAEKARDNILPKLLANSETNQEALFRQELAKYDGLVKEVDANAAKQAQLLGVIATSYATFRSSYGFAEWRKSCEASGGGLAAAQGIRTTIASFKELRDNLGEGLRFYMSLQEAIGALKQQVGDHCMTRRIQRDDLIEDLKKQADEAERAAAQVAALRLAEAQAQQAAAQQAQQAAAQQAQQAAAAQAAAAAAYPPPPTAHQQFPGGYPPMHGPPSPAAAAGAPAPPQGPPPPQQQQAQQGGGYWGGYPPQHGPPSQGGPPPQQQQQQHQPYLQPSHSGGWPGYQAPPPQSQARRGRGGRSAGAGARQGGATCGRASPGADRAGLLERAGSPAPSTESYGSATYAGYPPQSQYPAQQQYQPPQGWYAHAPQHGPPPPPQQGHYGAPQGPYAHPPPPPPQQQQQQQSAPPPPAQAQQQSSTTGSNPMGSLLRMFGGH
eukprot:scaffold22.g6063.t1